MNPVNLATARRTFCIAGGRSPTLKRNEFRAVRSHDNSHRDDCDVGAAPLASKSIISPRGSRRSGSRKRWLEHLGQHERVTNADRVVQAAVYRFQTEGTPTSFGGAQMLAARRERPARDAAQSRPELHLPSGAAQPRIVSVARIRLDSRKSVRPFKGIIYDDISEFESYHLSQRISD
jgi:hypothetical protein